MCCVYEWSTIHRAVIVQPLCIYASLGRIKQLGNSNNEEWTLFLLPYKHYTLLHIRTHVHALSTYVRYVLLCVSFSLNFSL